MRVLLVAGGWSSEREVALSGAKGIERALKELGHEVRWLDPAEEFDSLCREAKRHDFAFLSLHGAPGEDGLIQAMLDAVGCPFQGAGPAGSFLALNKASSKQLFRLHGLLTADWEFVPCPASEFQGYETGLPFPVFAKSNTGGSSLDMGRANNARELNQVLAAIFAKGHDALIEPVIKGVELTCAVLDDEPLPPIQITAKAGDFFDYTSKYQQGGAEEICPAPVSPEITARLQKYALAAHRILGLEGYSRADFIRRDDDLYLLEVNTLPGMTPTSLLPQAAQEAGYDFPALLARLMELGIKRQKKRLAQEPGS